MSVQEYLEPAVKDYADQAKATYSAELDPQTFMGKQYVAGEDPLQTQAINLATAGVGSYQPFLQAAQTGVSGLSSLTGPQAYQPFMSPYQQQVIDTTLAEYDRSRTGDRQSIQDAAVATGNFGGGREGAMLGEYDARTLADRSALQAQMLQSGFQNAQQAASNAFTQGGQLVDQQYGLSNFQRSGLGADVGALGQLGSLRQGLTQAQLQADQQAARTAAYEPYGRLSQYGQGLTGLSGGVSSAAYAEPTPVSPMSQAIGTALGVGGLYGKIFGFPGSD